MKAETTAHASLAGVQLFITSAAEFVDSSLGSAEAAEMTFKKTHFLSLSNTAALPSWQKKVWDSLELHRYWRQPQQLSDDRK